jgi:ABC-type Fe3+-citrate transport system substrate-binding protein
MKSFKTWLVAVMSVLMLLGVATGCADTGNDETETEETEQNEEGSEEGTENTEE